MNKTIIWMFTLIILVGTVNAVDINPSYDINIIEQTSYWVNVTYNSTNITSLLNYNGTVYEPIKESNTTHTTFSNQFTAPNIDTKTSYNFFWSYIVFDVITEQALNFTSVNNNTLIYYPFNGTATDYGVLNNNGLIVGAVNTSNRFGVGDEALSFNGTGNYVKTSKAINLDATNFTFCAYVLINTTSALSEIIGNSRITANPNYPYYRLQEASGYFRVSADNGAGHSKYIISNKAYNDNSWHLVCAGMENVTMWLSIDLDAKQTITYSYLRGGLRNLSIGGTVTNPTYDFHGSIDDVTIYNSSLTLDQIRQVYPSNSSFTTTYNHSIYPISLTNCTTGNIVLNISIYNENYPTIYVPCDVEVKTELMYSNNQYNYSFKLDDVTNFSICLNPDYITAYTNLYVQYESTDGFLHRYYLFNHNISDTTQQISMYNWNTTTGASDLILTLRDRNTYEIYSNIIGQLQRQYVSENVWRTVQMDLSSSFGLLHYNIIESDVDYRIRYLDTSNNLLEEGTSGKYVCTSGVCELTKTLLNVTTETIDIDLDVTASFNNATKLITVIWNDELGLVNSIRYEATQSSAFGTNTICSGTQTGSSGTFNCNTTGYEGAAYIKIWKTASPETTEWSWWIDLDKLKLADVLKSSGDSTIWTFGIVLTIVGTGVTIGSAAVITATIFGLIVIYFLGLFTPINLTFLIIATVIGLIIATKTK